MRGSRERMEESDELQKEASSEWKACKSSILRAAQPSSFLDKVKERQSKRKTSQVKKVAAAEANDLFFQSLKKTKRQ